MFSLMALEIIISENIRGSSELQREAIRDLITSFKRMIVCPSASYLKFIERSKTSIWVHLDAIGSSFLMENGGSAMLPQCMYCEKNLKVARMYRSTELANCSV